MKSQYPNQQIQGLTHRELQSRISARQMASRQTPPIDIVFRNLKYAIKIKNNKSTLCHRLPKINKEILKGVTGIIKHGRVTAIMGASSAGKTSLLNILACRINKGRKVQISGEVLVNMRSYNYDLFGDFANYVMQNDILMSTLTVRETLEFAASMTLNRSSKERDQIIDRLIRDLKLEKCADVIVGGTEIKGISGGQRKRTSIAFELVSDPQVIFLDEPTSGLDSLTAYVIVWYMKRLAASRKKTIVMTIHQPSSQIFHLFDDFIFMVAGRLVYQGPAADSVEYFTHIGFRSPQFSNPPDYFMSIMHHESKKNVANYPRYFQSYDEYLAPKIDQVIKVSEAGPWHKRIVQTSFCRGLYTLMWRDFHNIKRNPMLLIARVLQTIILSLITGAVFWKLQYNYTDPSLSSKSFASKNGVLFFLSVATFMTSFVPVILTFPIEKSVFLKERSNKMYSVFAYFFSRNIMELILIAVGPILNSLIVYWMIDLHHGAGYFFMYLLISFLASLAGNSYGFLVSSFFNNPRPATAVLPLVSMTTIVFSGFYKNRQDIAGWVVWINYLSPIKYSFMAYAHNEYHNTAAPIERLGFELSLAVCLILLVVLSVVARLIAFTVLSLSKKKLQ